MREIKFRAWDKKDKEMFYNIQTGIDFGDGSNYGFKNFLGIQKKDDYHKWELMQFTGLKDKNRKEIYEGDIIKTFWEGFSNKYWYVGFNYGQFVLINDMGREFGFDLNWENENQTEYEIIGNIYESPELLKKGKINEE